MQFSINSPKTHTDIVNGHSSPKSIVPLECFIKRVKMAHGIAWLQFLDIQQMSFYDFFANIFNDLFANILVHVVNKYSSIVIL